MKNKLSDVFDNGGYDHFTHYDYLLQLKENGQMSAFKDHLKTLIGPSLLALLPEGEKKWEMVIRAEILERINK